MVHPVHKCVYILKYLLFRTEEFNAKTVFNVPPGIKFSEGQLIKDSTKNLLFIKI